MPAVDSEDVVGPGVMRLKARHASRVRNGKGPQGRWFKDEAPVKVAVQDEGDGMPPDYLDEVRGVPQPMAASVGAAVGATESIMQRKDFRSPCRPWMAEEGIKRRDLPRADPAG